MKADSVLKLLVALAIIGKVCSLYTSHPASKVTVYGTDEISFTEDLESYRHNPNSPANTFDIYEKRIQMSVTKDFNGNRNASTATDADLPKADQGEYDRVTLTPGVGNLGTLREEVTFNSKALSRLVTLSNEHEIQLVEGTWDGYRNGQDVKFVASPRGVEQIKTHLKDEAKPLLAEASSAVARQVEAAGGKNVSFTATLDDVQISNQPVTANLKTVKIHDTGLTRMVCNYHGEGAKASN